MEHGSVRRWDQPWAAPTGTRPQKAEGEPRLSVLVGLHLAFFFALGAVDGATASLAGRSAGWAAGVSAALAVALGAGGVVSIRHRDPLWRWVGDLLLFGSVLHVFGAAAGAVQLTETEDATIPLVGCLAALAVAAPLYLAHRRLWLQIATTASLAGALTSAIVRADGMPAEIPGAFLLIVAAFAAVGAHAEFFRPVGSGYVLSALLALVGTQVLLSGDVAGGYLVAAVLLVAVGAGVVRSGRASLLPVFLLGSLLLLPQLLGDSLGTGYTIGLTGAATGAAAAALAADVARRSVRPVRTGGVFALSALLVLTCAWPLSHADTFPLAVVGVVALAVVLAAAVVTSRIVPAVLIGLVLLARIPAVFSGSGEGPGAVVAGLLVAAAGVVACIWLVRQPPRAAAAPAHREDALTRPGREWTVLGAYPQVFDGIVAVLAAGGLELQLVDRAAGRVIAGPALQPVLVVAVWGADPVRTWVRAVGHPLDVDRLERELADRLGRAAWSPTA